MTDNRLKICWDKAITQLIREGSIKESELHEVSVEEKNIALLKIDAILECLKPEVPERKE